MRIFKFGGASVKDAEGIHNMYRVLEQTGHEQTLIVVSAMGKTTNAFEKLIEAILMTPNKSSHNSMKLSTIIWGL